MCCMDPTMEPEQQVAESWQFGRIQYWHPPGQQQQGEQELATKMLQIQSKRFYLDVKQNRRGRFIKVAEIGADGRRSQIFLALSTAAEFRDHLSTFSDFYASLGPPNPENVPEDGKLKSEMMIKDNRRYYLDLKENSRGRFLRVSVSQTITRGGPRSQIAIPAQGMIEFRDALTDLLEEFGTDDGGFKGELPEGRHMRVENKNFYFDIGQNNRGIYMRISEVKTNFRTAITVPEKSWARFRDIFADYCEKMKEGGEKVSVGGGSDGGPSAKYWYIRQVLQVDHSPSFSDVAACSLSPQLSEGLQLVQRLHMAEWLCNDDAAKSLLFTVFERV